MKAHGGAQAYVFAHNTSSTHMKMPLTDKYPPELCTRLIVNNLSIGPANAKLVAEYSTGQASQRHVIGHNAYNKAASKAACKVGKQKYDSLAEMREAMGHERGSLFVDGYGVFADAPEPPHTKRNTPLVMPTDVDLTLKADAAPVDAGTLIPGVNDDFTGDAPDIGAYESGNPVPVYGPRGGPYVEKLKALRVKNTTP